MTTAEAIPVAADELGIKNVANGESPPQWTFMLLLRALHKVLSNGESPPRRTFPPRKNEESCLGLKKK